MEVGRPGRSSGTRCAPHPTRMPNSPAEKRCTAGEGHKEPPERSAEERAQARATSLMALLLAAVSDGAVQAWRRATPDRCRSWPCRCACGLFGLRVSMVVRLLAVRILCYGWERGSTCAKSTCTHQHSLEVRASRASCRTGRRAAVWSRLLRLVPPKLDHACAARSGCGINGMVNWRHDRRRRWPRPR